MDQGFAFPAEETTSDASQRRREIRHAVFYQATLNIGGLPEGHAIRVRDLSPWGLMGETSLSLRRGQEVGVTIGGMLQQVARVRWVNGKRFGLKFAHPVNLRMLRAAMMAPKSPATVIVAASKDQRRPGLRIR